ncbi:MAG: hypothetical protein ACYDG6_08075 [Thermincolia bacterium]
MLPRQWERGKAMDYQGLVLTMLLGLVAGGLVFYFASRYALYSTEVNLVIGVKNQEAYVEGVVRGIFALTYKKLPDFSLVIIDLGSADKTPVILNKLSKQYPGMVYVDGTTYPGRTTVEEIALLKGGSGGAYYLDWVEPTSHRQIVPLVNKLLLVLNSASSSVESVVTENLYIKRLEWRSVAKKDENGTKVPEK